MRGCDALWGFVLMTSIAGSPASLAKVEGAPEGWEAHGGMARCAAAVLESIESHSVLATAAAEPRHAGWRLILTGHSLGAGVATLLGAKMRGRWPGLHVWAFSPPGGVCLRVSARLSAGVWSQLQAPASAV